MVSKTDTCKVADLEFDGIGRRYEDFVHQGSCTDSRERIRAITIASFFWMKLLLSRLMGVSAPSLHTESTDSLIYIYGSYIYLYLH